jgi:hypothetical protein
LRRDGKCRCLVSVHERRRIRAAATSETEERDSDKFS